MLYTILSFIKQLPIQFYFHLAPTLAWETAIFDLEMPGVLVLALLVSILAYGTFLLVATSGWGLSNVFIMYGIFDCGCGASHYCGSYLVVGSMFHVPPCYHYLLYEDSLCICSFSLEKYCL